MAANEVRGSSDRSVLVLTSLAGGPKHGYALDSRRSRVCRSATRAWHPVWLPVEAGGGRFGRSAPRRGARRHPYRITTSGLEVLRRQLSESARIAEIGLDRIAGAMT